MEWNLIVLALKQFGFNPWWINWVKECISTMSYSLLLNGSPFGFIIPPRGLRQGDPLSPFLLVIEMQILSRMLEKAWDFSWFQGMRLSLAGPPLSHLLYVDDLILFGQASMREARCFQQCLDLFSSCFGQAPNAQKSTIFSTKNTLRVIACTLRDFSSFKPFTTSTTHLGLPLLFPQSKLVAFCDFQLRIDWKILE